MGMAVMYLVNKVRKLRELLVEPRICTDRGTYLNGQNIFKSGAILLTRKPTNKC